MNKTSHIRLPFTNARIKTLNKAISGSGTGSVLLDNGMGGQSSYPGGVDDYIATTGRNPYTNVVDIPSKRGNGLADKLSRKLSALNIEKPSSLGKKKNITMNF